MKKHILMSGLILAFTLTTSFSAFADGPGQQAQTGYYEVGTEVFFKDDHIIYRGSLDNNVSNIKVYIAKPDLSEPTVLINNSIFDMVMGPDNNLYYSDLTGGLNRYNFSNNSTEVLYTPPSLTWIRINFADSTGIQTTAGYYDITSQAMNVDVRKDSPKSKYSLNGASPAPAEYRQAISSQNTEYTKIVKETDNYVVVATYKKSERADPLRPFDKIGEYIIEKSTKHCVAYKAGDTFNGEISNLYQDPSGLYVYINKEFYRVENGGAFTKITLSENPNAYVSIRAVKNGLLYYFSENYAMHTVNLGTAPLPTTPVLR